MATIMQQPAAFSLTSGLTDIVIATGAEKCRIEVLIDSEAILDETMYADTSGNITLTDLAVLVGPYARKNLVVSLAVRMSELDSEGNATATQTSDTITVLCGAADVGTTAQDFCNNHFLTILNGEKVTAYGREERLYAYGATQVTVNADVMAADGSITAMTATLNTAGTTKGVSAFMVSPDNIATLLALTSGQVIGYTVTAGARKQHFVVMSDEEKPAPVLAFVNSFGCIEFLHCCGKHMKESKYTRSMARLRGMRRNYLIEEDRQFTANTGVLNQWMADWADDLLRSYEVYLWVDGVKGKEVVITDSKSEIDNLPDSMPAFELTYGYAQRNHNVMQPQHAGRIFDNTFDHTFE